VVIPAGLVTSDGISAVVVNQRTGEGVSVPAPAEESVEIPLLQFARDDSALLGFSTANPACSTAFLCSELWVAKASST
jgi:hypothetical protein